VWSDSQYALGVISGRTKAHTNLDLVAKCRATAFEVGARGIRLDFRWVKGHDGDPGNHIADRLAALWRN
jgi:ribonuclease HI